MSIEQELALCLGWVGFMLVAIFFMLLGMAKRLDRVYQLVNVQRHADISRQVASKKLDPIYMKEHHLD